MPVRAVKRHIGLTRAQTFPAPAGSLRSIRFELQPDPVAERHEAEYRFHLDRHTVCSALTRANQIPPNPTSTTKICLPTSTSNPVTATQDATP